MTSKITEKQFESLILEATERALSMLNSLNESKGGKVKMTEARINRAVDLALSRVLKEQKFLNEKKESEDDVDEISWNGTKTAAKAFFSPKAKGGGLKKRINNAVTGYNSRVEYDDTNELLQKIKEFIQKYNQRQDELYQKKGWDKRYANSFKIKNSTTVGELIGYTNRKGKEVMSKVSQGALRAHDNIKKVTE